jgi:hypothetical protein
VVVTGGEASSLVGMHLDAFGEISDAPSAELRHLEAGPRFS